MSSEEDVIEKTIGRFGRYQTAVLILVLLGRIPCEFQLFNIVFILPTVDFICVDTDGNITDGMNTTSHCPCDHPLYDVATTSSVTTEWDLICERSLLASLSQAVLQLGYLPGSVLCGYLADRFGRKVLVCSTFLLTSLLTCLSAAVPQLWMFMLVRALTGITMAGIASCSYVYMIELTGTSFRTFASAFLQIPSIGYFTTSLLAYYVREWRYMQLAGAAPWLLTAAYFWILPESPRWLITAGKTKKAVQTLTRIAKRNGLPVEQIESIVSKEEYAPCVDREPKNGSYMDLFKIPKMRQYSLSVLFIWMVCGHTYYGIHQCVGMMHGNLYLNTTLTAISLLPGTVIVATFTKYLNRRTGLAISFTVISVSMLTYVLVPSSLSYLKFPLLMMGLLGSYTAFSQTYLHTSEVFPTVVRSYAIGLASMSSHVGSALAPFAVNIGNDWATNTIFIVVSSLAAMLCFLLPETKHIVLPNTIAQTETLAHTNITDSDKRIDAQQS